MSFCVQIVLLSFKQKTDTSIIFICCSLFVVNCFDKTVFKAYGLDAKIDPRNLKDMELYKKIKEYAPTDEIKKSLEKAEKNKRFNKTK